MAAEQLTCGNAQLLAPSPEASDDLSPAEEGKTLHDWRPGVTVRSLG